MDKPAAILSILIVLLALTSLAGQPDTALTLEGLVREARAQSPVLRQKRLIADISAKRIENIQSEAKPQAALTGQFSYQSQVTKLPIELPNFSIDPLSRDQYRVQAEVQQSIYDGGVVKNKIQLQHTAAQLESLNVELELEKLREQIIQVYFDILQFEAQERSLLLAQNDIRNSSERLSAAVQNGTALATELDALSAELLKLDQQLLQLRASRRAQLEVLRLLTKRNIPESIELRLPPVLTIDTNTITARPLIQLYRAQGQQIAQKHELDGSIARPKVQLFAQVGYGRPGLDFLENSFSPYFIGGLRANWNLGHLYTRHNDRQITLLERARTQTSEEAFRLQIQTKAQRYEASIAALEALMQKDVEIVALRNQIQRTSQVRLDNGVLTSSDYLKDLNAAERARQNQLSNRIEWLRMQYLWQHVLGGYEWE